MESFAGDRHAATSFTVAGTTAHSVIFEIETSFLRGIVFDNGVLRDVPACTANDQRPRGDIVTTVRNSPFEDVP